MAENGTKDIKVQLEGLRKEIENINSINTRIDTAIEKLTDLSTSIKSFWNWLGTPALYASSKYLASLYVPVASKNDTKGAYFWSFLTLIIFLKESFPRFKYIKGTLYQIAGELFIDKNTWSEFKLL